MILRTSIYNHNYYPIKLSNVDQEILMSDSTTVHKQLYINDTSFDEDLGLMIKPFQDVEYLTNIELKDDITAYKGELVFEQIFSTDSYDYSHFGNLSKQEFDVNKRSVMVKRDDISRTVGLFSEENYDLSEFIDIEFNMKGISDQDDFYNYLKTFNLENFEIDEVDFYSNGIYRILIPESHPKCEIIYYRGAEIPELFTPDIITMCETNGGSYKVQIDKNDGDVQVKLRISLNTLNLISTKLSKQFAEEIKIHPLTLPIAQFPVGMSVILNLSPQHKNPFKLNLKIYTNINIKMDVGEGGGDPNTMPAEIKEFLKVFFSPSTNRNTLLASPASIKVFSNPFDFYSGETKLYVYPFKNESQEKSWEEVKYEITDVKQKNTDSFITTGDVTLSHDQIPSFKIIPYKETYLDRNPFDIYIDTTNLLTDYTNSIIVDFKYNDVIGSKEIPVYIYPNIELEPVLILEKMFQTDSKTFEAAKFPSLNTNIGHCDQEDTLTIVLNNIGNTNAKIKNVEILDIDDYKDIFKDDEEALLNIKDVLIKNNQKDLLTLKYAELNITDENLKLDPIEYEDKGKLSDYISYKIDKIENEDYNLNNLKPVIITLKIKRLKETDNKEIGKVAIIKITYNENKYYYTNKVSDSLRIINTQLNLTYEKSQELTYVRANVRNTIFVKLFKTAMKSIQSYYKPVVITDAKIINYDNNIDTYITNDEIFIDKSIFPFSVLSSSVTPSLLGFDINLSEEKLYQFKLRLYTNIVNIPYIDIPYEIICTNINVEEIIQFDKANFYVRNNKYFLSLNRLIPKKRDIKIQNFSDINIIVKSIKFDLPTSQIGIVGISTNQLAPIQYPYNLTNKNPINLKFEFIGSEYGRTTGFIILDTDLGQVYLPIVIFVNTKLKDVMVLMENKRGVEFTSALNSVSKNYIKLINFGDDLSLTEITKLGYDKNEFLIENNPILFPNSVNYIETMFTPTSTGKKIGYTDIKIRDMLETYILRDTDWGKTYKIQNTHIITEMSGTALSGDALPQFSKSVVDFGYVDLTTKDQAMRYDVFDIVNLGLTPFIITSITKLNSESPFIIPLSGQKLPMKIDKKVQLPIQLNNKKFNNNQKVYIDVFRFEMQDLKTKKMFTYDIIVKIELSEINREYFSFNSENIDFGFCSINAFKEDEIIIKNYSTDKVVLNIDTTGDNDLQTVDNMTINLQAGQSFVVPLFFYPHGIANFSSDLILNFNEGNYIKKIPMSGSGVDFSSPLITVKNAVSDYYRKMLDESGAPKYI